MAGTTRAERLSLPLGATAIRDLTEAAGGCIRPVQLRRTSKQTGEVDYQFLPCRSTLEDACPPCAARARSLRAEQCRDGWHLDTEPETPRPAPDETAEFWLTARAAAQAQRDKTAASGENTTELDELLAELDNELAALGIRGNLATRTNTGTGTGTGTGSDDESAKRRSRSTRRRQDTPDLPKRKLSPRTTGRAWTTPDGKTYRPSMFLTLTLDSYGKVGDDGTPRHPDSYDYQRAARDAIAFPALFDRLMQNLRRYLGYDVQYFAAIEPQKRLAPHAHIAFRGAISRADIRQVIAATYHQVWWPSTTEIRYPDDQLPIWHEPAGGYVDRTTGEVLPTWDQALDTIGPHDQPRHVARFGPKFDAQGVLAGTKDAARCVSYLTKYLTKQIAGCHKTETDGQRDHADRLAEALRYEPCSPRCANWLRYGIQPKNARPDLKPGYCRGKAHRYENLGYAGRRVLVSRKWSGKTLTDHRADRKAWLMAMLDLPATDDSSAYQWERVTPDQPDHMPLTQRLMHVLAERAAWNSALAEARRRTAGEARDLSATSGREA
jgi:hypothetical protein